MAKVKNNKNRASSSEGTSVARALKSPVPVSAGLGGWLPVLYMPWFIVLIALLYYVNSVGGDFVMDDAIVISDNQFTMQGIRGWAGIFGHDTFFGFFKEANKAHLVAGGRYRPLTLAMFAVEGQLFGFKPLVFHIFNLVYFALTSTMVFIWLRRLLNYRLEDNIAVLIAFFAALIFAVHPIHTEVVANIKGRDEIVCLLLGLFAGWAYLRALDQKSILWAGIAGGALFLSMLAKENGIIFMALVPFSAWFFAKFEMRRIISYALPMLVMTVVYLVIRQSVLGPAPDTGPIMELMNNPFLRWVGNGYLPVSNAEKFATIAVTLGKYLWLSFFPHPLTSDYYPQQISIVNWSNTAALFPAIIYMALIAVVMWRLRRSEVPVFGAIIFLTALFPVANIVMPVGTLMSERFLFIPSVGVSLLMGWVIARYVANNNLLSKYNTLVLVIILILGIRTITRNADWANNFTLFTTDVKVSPNSAKMRNSAGGILVDSASRVEDPVLKETMLAEARMHLEKAIELHPSYANAYLLLGNVFAHSNNYLAASKNYEKALAYNPGFKDARNNLSIAFRELGKAAGEREGDVIKAIELLTKSEELSPEDPETLRLLGVGYGISGDNQAAIAYFAKALTYDPENAYLMWDLGTAYQKAGDEEKGHYYHSEAVKRNLELQKRMNSEVK